MVTREGVAWHGVHLFVGGRKVARGRLPILRKAK